MKILDEIKSLIEKSENPIFFYDDDPDGMVSYLLLKKYFKKGEGFIVRVRGKNLDEEKFFLRKIKERSPDLVVFLDKPTLTQELFDRIHVKKIWIDHHTPVKVKGVVYYNPKKEIKKNQPVSYVCYQITKQDLWLAAVGVTADWSDLLIKDFRKKYPEFVDIKGGPGDYLYKTKLGEIARRFSFILKGKTEDIRKSVNLLLRIEDLEEIWEGKTKEGKALLGKVNKIKKKYDKLLTEALKENKRGKFLIFRYASKISFTSELANELVHRYSKKIIMVARETSYEEIRISLRSGEKGVKVLPILKKTLEGIKGKGGGHEHACATIIKKEDFNNFIELFKENVKK